MSKISILANFLLIIFPFAIVAGRAPGDSVLSLIVLLFLLNSALSRNFSWMNLLWVKIFFILWSWMLLRTAFASNPLAGLDSAIAFARYGLFAAAVANWLLPNSKTERYVWLSLIVSCTFLALDGLYQFITGVDIFGIPRFNDIRLAAFYGAPILGHSLAPLAVLASGPILALVYNKAQKNKWHWNLLLVIPVFWFLVVVLSGDRSATIAFALAGIFALIIWCKRAPTMVATIATLVIVMLGAVFSQPNNLFTRHVLSVAKQIGNLGGEGYGSVYQSALLTIKENWLFGVGTKHFRSECVQVGEPCYTHPHNIYLEAWAETGIIGLLLFGAFFFIVFRHAWSIRNIAYIYPHYTGCLALFCVKIFPLLPAASFRASWAFMAFWFAIGWLMSMKPDSGQDKDIIRKRDGEIATDSQP